MIMSRYRRATGSTFFFTVFSCRRRAILCDDRIRTALRQAIALVRSRHPFVIEACVLLPNHIHTIWTLPDCDNDFSIRWSEIKRFVSSSCRAAYHEPSIQTQAARERRESTIWHRRFWEHRIRDEHDFARHCDYIHFNPVKHGQVRRVGDWPYSTFHRYVRHGIYAHDWAGTAECSTLEFE